MSGDGIGAEDLIRDIGSFIEIRPLMPKQSSELSDIETFATVEASYVNDYTVDITLGKVRGGLKGKLYKKIPVKLRGGENPDGYGEFDLPNPGDIVTVHYIHGRGLIYVDGSTIYFRSSVKNQVDEQKKITSKLLSFFENVADKGKVFPSGTKYKVKANGDVVLNTKSGVNIKVTGTKVTIDGATAIEFGDTVLKLVTEAFMNLYNQHTHPTSGGPSSPPVVPMTTSHLTTKLKGE